METYLYRNGKGKNPEDISTVSDFVVKDISCYVCEDDYDEVKEYGHTRIPAGRYEIKLKMWGGHHDKYQIRFGEFHVGMLQLMNVPNYKDILIHCGNTAMDTAGCLLPGVRPLGKGVSGSEIAYRKIYPVISMALIKGERVFINILD